MVMSSAKLSSTERVGRDTETEWVVKVSLKGSKGIGNRQSDIYGLCVMAFNLSEDGKGGGAH
jgi:hypothetical protein